MENMPQNKPEEKQEAVPARPEFDVVRPEFDVVRIVQQLEDLVRLAVECEGKELVSSANFLDIHAKLLAIRKNLQIVEENYQLYLQSTGMTPEQVKKNNAEQVNLLGKKEKSVLERMMRLQKKCEDEREKIHQSLLENADSYKEFMEEIRREKLQKTQRKGRFKSVGGKKNWLPT
jgi:hypothetical protein